MFQLWCDQNIVFGIIFLKRPLYKSLFSIGATGTLVFGLASKDLAAQVISGLSLHLSDKMFEVWYYATLFLGLHFIFGSLKILFRLIGWYCALFWWNFWSHWRSWMGEFIAVFTFIHCRCKLHTTSFIQMETRIRNSDELSVKIPNTQVMSLECLPNTYTPVQNLTLWVEPMLTTATLARRTKDLQSIPHTSLPGKTNSAHKLRRCLQNASSPPKHQKWNQGIMSQTNYWWITFFSCLLGKFRSWSLTGCGGCTLYD